MSLILSQVGEEVKIKKITGNSETKKFLNSLGFVIGEGLTIISDLGGNLIVNIKGSRIALDKSMASRIIV
ncbi:FeoA family protein [Clostridioides difficile]